MNYILTVDSSKIDQVILRLSELDVQITDIIRSTGTIHVSTKSAKKLNQINEVINIKKNAFFLHLLVF